MEKIVELYNDNFQNWKKYLHVKAQLIIADPPYCYDTQTECFTKDGWKRIEDIDITDTVLSLNHVTMEMEYSGIERIIIKEAPEKLLHFQNKSLDLCVTDNHRVFCNCKTRRKETLGLRKRSSKYESDLNIRLASEITESCTSPIFGYKWKGEKLVNGIIIDGCFDQTNRREQYKKELFIDWETWLPFFGLWLADGYTCKNKYTTGIKQGGHNRNIVKEILSRLPFKWHEYEEKGTDKSNFDIHDKQLAKYMYKFGGSHDKFIPREILDLPKEYLDILFKWYTFGDSTRNGRGTRLSSVSRRLIENLQELQLKRGEICQIREQTHISLGSPLYYFQTDKSNNSIHFGKPTEEQPKDKFVWCLSLQTNSVFLVRRNGKIIFCGNCIGKNAYASNPSWYKDGDNKNGESELAGKEFFDTDKDFRPAEFMHFCSQMLVKEPKNGITEEESEAGQTIGKDGKRKKSNAPCMVLFCAFEQLQYYIDLGKRYGFKHYIPLVFRKNFSAQVLKANMKIVGNCEYGLVLYKDKLPKFNNDGRMVFNCIDWVRDTETPKVHPTQKPLGLIEFLISVFTDKDDVVIDPCAGSGVSLLAAANLCRRAYGFEIKKDFFKEANEKILRVVQPKLFL